MNRYLIFLLIITLGFTQCDDDDGIATSNVEVNFNALFQSEAFEMSKAYTDPLGNSLRYLTFKFYISDLILVQEDNTKVEVSDIELVDFLNVSSFSIDADVPEATYKAIEFGLGVSSDLNSQDPSMFPNEHPLSSFANTFWTWQSKYRFALIEGDIDTTGGMSFSNAFIYHTGLDSLYRTKSIPISLVVSGDNSSVDLTVQTADIFFNAGKEIDYITESTTHTTDNVTLAERVTDNLVDAIY